MKYIGSFAAGEPLEAENAADALDVLNGMLDAWTMDRLYVYASTISTYALTSGTQSYSIGATASAPWNVTRPNKIEEANIVITSQTPNVRTPLYIMDDSDWMSISIRPLQTPFPVCGVGPAGSGASGIGFGAGWAGGAASGRSGSARGSRSIG